MASAYSGQTALCHLSAPSPTSNDGGGSRTSSAEAAGVLTASTTLDSYVPPKCLWSSARAGGGGGIVVYKVSSVRADLCAIQFVACMLLLCCDVPQNLAYTELPTLLKSFKFTNNSIHFVCSLSLSRHSSARCRHAASPCRPIIGPSCFRRPSSHRGSSP